MEKILDATFDGEVFRPDEPTDLPVNTKVKIHIEDEEENKKLKKLKLVAMPKKGGAKPYVFLNYLESLELGGPSDFSKNPDDYLYGGKSLEDGE